MEAVRNSGPLISTSFPGWSGPRHVVHFGAVLNHLLGLHMHKIAAGPPAHEYGSEVHPHMIVDSPVVRAGIGTEGAVGVISPDHGGNSIHDVGFSGGNLSQGRRAYHVVQPNVLFPPVLRMVTGYGVALEGVYPPVYSEYVESS